MKTKLLKKYFSNKTRKSIEVIDVFGLLQQLEFIKAHSEAQEVRRLLHNF